MKSCNPFWEFVHNAVAHPLMAVTVHSAWSIRFHDWTGDLAWGPGKAA